jgi:hypothetical protein
MTNCKVMKSIIVLWSIQKFLIIALLMEEFCVNHFLGLSQKPNQRSRFPQSQNHLKESSPSWRTVQQEKYLQEYKM